MQNLFSFLFRAMLAFSLILPPAFSVVVPTTAVAQARSVKAADLVASADRSVAVLVRVARQSKDSKLAADAEGAKPFWEALKSLNTSVAQLGNGLHFKDNTFHSALAKSVSGVAAVYSTYELSGAKDKNVNAAIGKLEKTIGALQENFSKASARKAKGGKLSAKEKGRLAKLRAKQKELEQKLAKVEPKVRNNARAMAGIREIRRRSGEVIRSQDTLGDFLAAMVAIRIVDGLLWGCHRWWGPWGGWYSSFSIGYVDIHNTIIADIDYDWAYYDAVQVELDDIELEAAIDDAELYDAEQFLENQDTGLDELTGDELEGVALPADGELDDPAFSDEIDDAALQPETLPTEEPGGEADTGDLDNPDVDTGDLGNQEVDTGDLGDHEVDTGDLGSSEVDPGNMNEAVDLPDDMPEIGNMDLGEPDVGDFAEFDDAGMDDFSFDDGGFDDLDGGFDFD